MAPDIDTPPSDSIGMSEKAKVLYFSNELPNDDLQGLFRRLHNHSKTSNHPLLARFLQEATAAIQDEVRLLPTELRSTIPPFENVLDLVDYPELRQGQLSGSIDGVLLCVTELASYLGHHESIGSGNDVGLQDACVAGLGIGLLVTSAVSLAPGLSDIPRVGAEIMRIAFRLGVLVSELSQNLEPFDQSGSPESWAYVVPDVTPTAVQKELDAIQSRECISGAAKVFISAFGEASVTVSGPPARLKALFRTSGFFRDRKFVALPVYGGLCHAKHLYGDEHVDTVLRTSSMPTLSPRFVPKLPIFSTSTGQPFPASDARGLFHQIISEILTQQIQWDRVVEGITDHVNRVATLACQVLIFRSSLPVHGLMASLKSNLPEIDSSTEDLIPWIMRDVKGAGKPRTSQQAKIAIVGMACRMPGGADSTEKFWELLDQGLDVHQKIPADRFDVETHHDPTGKRVNTSHTAYGCFIDEPGLFDAGFFHMSPREAEQTDPMQRLALVTAYEALERAGYVANRTAATNLHRIGTWYGQASDDYREVNTAQEISTYFITGGCRAFGPGRINYFFKFSGPSFNCDTACSSSLATIQAACSALWNGEVDTVVAGGVNVLTNSDAFAGLSHGHFLTKTPNACKTWDIEADGYCRADAVGSIVMKRLEDAEADNDNILGVILGGGTNHSAEAVSITHPHAGAQAYLTRQVLRQAGIDPLDVSFVEMHGTGTQAGDMQEIQSVTDVFAPVSAKRRNSKQPLHIGAVKSNVGHSEAAAGVTALLKVLLMFQKGAIPPHAGIKHGLNPAFPKDMDKRNVRIPYEKVTWQLDPQKKRIAVVNNFSAAGGNTSLAIEEPPLREKIQADPRPSHVVAVSAKSKVSLRGNLERMISYLDANPEVNLPNLSYSTTARRYGHNHRVAIATSDVAQLKKQLNSYLDKVDSHKPTPATGPPPIAFAFTGQGASYKSMNVELFHHSPFFRAQILSLDGLARGQGFPSFIPAMDGSFPQEHAHSPVITQLALVCSEIALARYHGSLGVKPNVVMGHSLGEYAALCVAGVLTANDAIFLVGHRARLLEQKCKVGSHRMLAVRASLKDIEAAAANSPFEIACVNGPADTVLSGPVDEMVAVAKPLEAAGYKCIPLDVAFAFHSAQTDPILDEYEAIAKSGVTFHAPNLPVISPLLSKVIFDDKTVNASYVRRATREPVHFLSALEKARKLGSIDDKTVWVEIGPHPVCCGFIKASLPAINVAVPSLRRGENSWSTIATTLGALHCAGVEIGWNEFHSPFESGLTLLDLPTYSWNEKTYWLQYNGDWALTKGNHFYDAEKGLVNGQAVPTPKSSLSTSSVQRIIDENFDGAAVSVTMQSDLMQAHFLAAAHGHKMNNCGVVTSSIHADIAWTLGEYIYKKFYPKSSCQDMNIVDLEVSKGLVAQKDESMPQLIQVSATCHDINARVLHLEWRNVHENVPAEETFATARILFGSHSECLTSWSPMSHLVTSRIAALEDMAKKGLANKLSHNMAYTLFGNNLVDYADKYRGMQSVVMKDYEAYADVTLTMQKDGVWTVAPYYIDSVCHLAGFIMNVSDAGDVRNNFCVTPGWQSMQIAKPLVAGARFRSYVKMIPSAEEPTHYAGDVYILQDDEVIGKVGGIQFRRYPRILLSRFFSPPDASSAASAAKSSAGAVAKALPAPTTAPKPTAVAVVKEPAKEGAVTAVATVSPPAATKTESAAKPAVVVVESSGSGGLDPDSTAAKALAIVAKEAGLDVAELTDESAFNNLGVDSLMSLVIAENFRVELGVSFGGSLFLEYPTVGDLRAWLEEYYS